MKNITLEACRSFEAFKPFKKSNTEVLIDQNGSAKMYLFGNLIAVNDTEKGLRITNAGWQSNTTKERLNSLKNVGISQKKGVWYLNGNQWDGSWIEIK